jgi:SMC interacting uncharacterized protein involved in chromosome segregation
MPLAIVGQHQFDSQAKGCQEAAQKQARLNPIQLKPRSVRDILAERERLTSKQQRFDSKLADAKTRLEGCNKRLKQLEVAVEELKAQPASSVRDVRLQQILGASFNGANNEPVHLDGEVDRLLARQAILERDVNRYGLAVKRTKQEVKNFFPSDEELAAAKRLEAL